MTTIHVSASREYDVQIGKGLLSKCGEKIAKFCRGGRCAVVTDDTVDALYGAAVEGSLRAAGIEPLKYVFPHGERGKSGENYLCLLEFLARHGLTRSDCIAALGGGVPGDLAGFAAATYQRGVNYVQIPTTLLAAVDSSVGGKTAIDLQAGKNLAGAFYQPCAVLCDVDTLDTLPKAEFRSGCAEVIKYAMLFDRAFFEELMESGPDFDRERVIARCVAFKRDTVAKDEFDQGRRQLLNFGHTVGHAIETVSGFTVPHGEAVAMGMAVITRGARIAGACMKSCEQAVENILKRFGLPTRCPYSAEAVCAAMAQDKKRRGSGITVVVPLDVGSCALNIITLSRLNEFAKAGIL